VTVTEGNSGTTPAVFTVTLSTASAQIVTVDYQTKDGSATSGTVPGTDADYLPTSGTLTFAPGETSKTITVQVIGDTIVEPNESFYVVLSNPVNTVIYGSTSAVGTILNDDGAHARSKALTAASTVATPVTQPLTLDQVGPLLAEAIARWAEAGVNTSSLNGVHVVITNLPGNELGEAQGHTIYLDSNAAGWGWFVDKTPW